MLLRFILICFTGLLLMACNQMQAPLSPTANTANDVDINPENPDNTPTPPTPTPTPPQESQNEIQKIINDAYVVILERPSNPTELTQWEAEFNTNDHTYLVDTLLRSTEFSYRNSYMNAEAFVNMSFANIFNRQPDPNELHHWSQRLNNGESKRVVYKHLLVSEEAKQTRAWLRKVSFADAPPPPTPTPSPTPTPTPPPPPAPPETGPDLDIAGRLIPTVTIEQMIQATQYGVLCENIGGQRSPGTGPGPCGSFQVVDNSCSAGMETRATSWQSHLGTFGFTSGTSLRMALPSYNVKIFKYRTPAEGEARPNGSSTTFPLVGSISWDEQYNRGPLASVFVVLSKKRCDFDYTKLDAGNPCYKTAQSGGVIPATVAKDGQVISPGNCRLEPNTDYYVSIRWENPTPLHDRGDGVMIGGSRGKDSCNELWGQNQESSYMRNHCGMVFLTNF